MSTHDLSSTSLQNPDASIESKLAAYKERLQAAGLDDNSATVVLVEILGDVGRGLRATRAESRRTSIGLGVVAVVFLLASGVLTAVLVRALKRDPSTAYQTAAQQFVESANRMEAAAKHIDSAADMNDVSARTLVKAVDEIGPVAYELHESRRTFEAAKAQPVDQTTVPKK